MKSLGINDPESDAYDFDIRQLEELIEKRQLNIDSYAQALEKTYSEKEDEVIHRAIRGEREQMVNEKQILAYLKENRDKHLKRKYGERRSEG